MNTLIIIGIGISCFILGYYYCMMRNRVKDLLKLANLFADYLLGTIDIEILREKFNKIK